MAINLATKYSKKIVDKFYLDSVVLGKTSKDYDWDGVNSVKVWTITTVQPGNYGRTSPIGNNEGASPAQVYSRYGTLTDVQDTLQTMTLTQDKSVALVVDKGDNTQQMLIKNSGVVMARELREQFIPMFDKYVIGQAVSNAGTNTVHASLTKSNIVEAIGDHVTELMNANTDPRDAYCFIGATNFGKLVLAPEFLNLEKLGEKAVDNGVVGRVRGLAIVPVPDAYLPSGTNFVTWKKQCILAPTQIKDAKVHQDPPGLSGALLEIRWLYDAFVLTTKNKGVIADNTTSV